MLAPLRDPKLPDRDRTVGIFQIFLPEPLRQVRFALADGGVREQRGPCRARERLALREHDACLELPEGSLVQMAEGAVFVFLFHVPLRTQQPHVEHPVVRKQQQPLRVLVEPADRMQRLLQRLREAAHDGLAPRVPPGGQKPAGLVEHVILRHPIPPSAFLTIIPEAAAKCKNGVQEMTEAMRNPAKTAADRWLNCEKSRIYEFLQEHFSKTRFCDKV